MRKRGRITEWNDERGFGFVTALDDESRAFVHISAFPSALRRPMALDLISYETTHDDRGRLQAMSVQFLLPSRTKATSGWTLMPSRRPLCCRWVCSARF